jgi:hypothetical protein
MKRTLGALTVVAAVAVGAASAQAAIVYETQGGIYVANNSGEGSKLLTAGGDVPVLTPDGQTVVYSGQNSALLKIPAAGGPSTQFGGTLTWCAKCAIRFAPDSRSILVFGANHELDHVPLDGTAPTRLATGVFSSASYSPDSKQVVFDQETPNSYVLSTVPVTGGPPTALAADFVSDPVWTTAGIVASTTIVIGKKFQVQIVLLDATGTTIKRVLQRKTYVSVKALQHAIGYPYPVGAPGSRLITYSLGKKHTITYRMISIPTGKVKATRTFSDYRAIASIGNSGKTILTVSRKGKLESVSFKTGKRKTLIKSGVVSANIN